jgi:hypothetical protein
MSTAAAGFREQLRFMFTTLHGGTVNLTLHLASIPVLLFGLARRQLTLIVAAGAMEAAGHAYNLLFRFDRAQRRMATRVLPLQLLLSVVAFVVLLRLFGWF